MNRRILLVCGPAAGGLLRHVETLLQELPRRGWEVALAAPEGVGKNARLRFPIDLADRPRPYRDLGAIRALRAASRLWRPALVHAHGAKATLLTAAGSPAPRVATFHNMWHGGALTPFLRAAARRMSAGIVVSVAVGASLDRFDIRHRALSVIRNGVDLSQLQPATAQRPDRPFTFAFLGRLTEEKGIPVLLRAAAGLPAGIQIRIAGDGPLRELVEKAAASAPERLQYLGHCADVLSLYHAVDAVVMPSLSEGLPMTALEAMACGLPLVASRVGGLPEVVQPDGTGLLVARADVDELAGAMARLAEDPDAAAAMGVSGRKRVEREFDQERMLERIEETYRSVLES